MILSTYLIMQSNIIIRTFTNCKLYLILHYCQSIPFGLSISFLFGFRCSKNVFPRGGNYVAYRPRLISPSPRSWLYTRLLSDIEQMYDICQSLNTHILFAAIDPEFISITVLVGRSTHRRKAIALHVKVWDYCRLKIANTIEFQIK